MIDNTFPFFPGHVIWNDPYAFTEFFFLCSGRQGSGLKSAGQKEANFASFKEKRFNFQALDDSS